MSEDIRKWSDGRYTLMFDEHTFFVWDNEKEKRMTALQVTKKLNEQQATITALKEENEQLRKKCFELEKDYLIETSDEVDKALYLEDDLKKLANEYGVEDE